VATSEQEIASLFDRWNNSLQTGDPHKVVATPEDKEDYFHNFLEDRPSGRI
jgi:hypothetical protein